MEIPNRILSSIRELIDGGRYESVQQFVEVALENQLFLQKLPADVYPEQPKLDKQKSDLSLSPSRLLSYEDRLIPMPPKDPPFTSEKIPIQKNTLWGLYNRVFPVKIALRVIANLAADIEKPFVDLMQVREEASKRARLVGRLLADDDEKTDRLHGEKLSTGLPIGRQDKAITRFKDMFVGFRRSKGDAGGLLVDLGLAIAKYDAKGRAVIALTKVGVDFVKLPNPILDARELATNVTLSEKEADLLLNHIREWLPLEYSLYYKILEAISCGKNTPSSVDLVIKSVLEGLRNQVLATERAGVISRLIEFGVLGRKRTGLNVSYTLTQRGEQLLKRMRETA